jgi:plasmid maintenance system antidote protein VapI
MAENLALWKIADHQGRRGIWLAEQIGVHPSLISKLRNGERRWTPEYKQRAAQALGVPVEVAFLVMPNGRQA